MNKPSLNDITIRTELRPGDIGDILSMHGRLYFKEYGYTGPFEMYVAQSLAEFIELYNPERNRIWVCEHNNRTVGTLVLLDRGDSAQLRYYLLEPEYRGIGLGAKLMDSLHGIPARLWLQIILSLDNRTTTDRGKIIQTLRLSTHRRKTFHRFWHPFDRTAL